MDTSRKEWLAWRKLGIGSSDAAVIHGVPDSFATPLQLWNEKLSDDLTEKPETWAMRKGNELEETARKLFATAYNMRHGTDETFAAKWFVLQDLEVIRASLDGISGDGSVMIECKFQGKEPHMRVQNSSLAIRGEQVTEKYWIQCQHGMLASGAKVCYFVSINPDVPEKDRIRVAKVEPDEEFLRTHIEKVAKWWKKHILGKIAPEETDRDYVELKKRGAKSLAKKFAKLKVKQDAIKKELEDVRTQLVELAETTKHPRLICGTVRFIQSERMGNVEYKNIPAIKAMKPEELDAFRKKASKVWTLDLV